MFGQKKESSESLFLACIEERYKAQPRKERVDFIEKIKHEFNEKVDQMVDQVDQIEYGQHCEGVYDITYNDIVHYRY
jgi:hypothetical protein